MRHFGLRWLLTVWMVLIQAWAPLVHAHVGPSPTTTGVHVHVAMGDHPTPASMALPADHHITSPHHHDTVVGIAQGLKTEAAYVTPPALDIPDLLGALVWLACADASTTSHSTPYHTLFLGECGAYYPLPRAPPAL